MENHIISKGRILQRFRKGLKVKMQAQRMEYIFLYLIHGEGKNSELRIVQKG